MMLVLVPAVLAESIFSSERPNGYYCESSDQCTSQNCVNNFCSSGCSSGCSRNIEVGGSEVITFFQENSQILRNFVIVMGIIMVLYILKLRGAF